jgi:N-acetyl sugar amidotransferase
MKYCKNCVYPMSAVALEIDDEGICSACQVAERTEALTEELWATKKKHFENLLADMTSSNTSNYDCIIPVSGGKDSYFQAHVIAEKYGLKPLLVTYHGNNYLPEGDYNRDRMRQVFNADHIVYGPNVDVLKKLNRICFKKMGDMNWHAHCGITTVPIQVAVKFKIPLIIWGETPWDVSGMFDAEDYPEFSARSRHEHDLRGFEWYDMLNDPVDKLAEKDVLWAKYPSDKEILDVGVRGIYIGNYMKWDPNSHTELMKSAHQWKGAEQPFERTYRTMSNLDDRYENGVHDLLKFVKFGYGRASDHASKDIRSGYMTRAQGVEMVKKYDHVVSSDLNHWLGYVGMEEDEFWAVADTFRDPRVWRIMDKQWVKDTIWGKPEAFGDVRLTPDGLADWRQRALQVGVTR